MFIRAIAKDLYKSRLEVEELEKSLLNAGDEQTKRGIEEELRLCRAELAQIQRILDSHKEGGAGRK